MLWQQLKPSYRRLVRRGLQGEAVIARATADRVKGRIGGILGWKVTIRVKFDDNSSADFERYVAASVLSFDGEGPVRDLAAGMVVPIRFDPVKRSRVEIDNAALRSQWAGQQSRQSAQAEASQDAAVLEAQKNLKPIVSQPSPPSDSLASSPPGSTTPSASRPNGDADESIEQARQIWRENLKQGYCTQAEFDKQMRELDEA